MTILHDKAVSGEPVVTIGPASRVMLKAGMLEYALVCLDEMEIVTDHDARLIRDVRAAYDDLSNSLEMLREELHLISRAPVSFNTNEYISLRKRIDNLSLNVQA
jgi:hypothetical protein